MIKAVTVDAASAWALMTGVRRVVDRPRGTRYRGRLAIHAGQLDQEESLVRGDLSRIGSNPPEDIARGAILGTAELVNVIKPGSTDAASWRLDVDPIAKGPFCWVLVNARGLPAPVPFHGHSGLWLADVDWKVPSKGCVYCGARTKLSRDHIPAAAIFPRMPARAVTVPACPTCNQEYSKDDVYFRDVLVAHQEVADCPEALEVQAAMMRSFGDPRQKGYTRGFFNHVKLVNPKTPAGLLLPRQPALDLESHRLERVVERIVRGLFYHEFADRISDGYEIRSFCVTDRLRQSPDACRDFIQEVFPLFNWSPVREVGPGVFKYRLSLSPCDRYTSMWLLAFYERVHFYACVIRENVGAAHPSARNVPSTL